MLYPETVYYVSNSLDSLFYEQELYKPDDANKLLRNKIN